MKTIKQLLQRILFVFLFLTFYNSSFSKVTISLDDPNISYDGVFYPVITSNKVQFNRHLSSMINNWESGIAGSWINQWVITQTGVRIRFKTASPTIDLKFGKRIGGGTIGSLPSTGFTVFVNGVQTATFSDTVFTVNNPNPGTSNTFEVTLPNLWAVDFTGMQIDDTYALESPGALNKPVYVSIGNSITHGTGQYVSAAKGYPFLLAKKMDWDLHNIAVAGSTLGWAIALNIKGKHVDFITVKIGFNDWKYTSDPLSVKKAEYGKLIDSLRAYQPTARIFCITPIYTADNDGSAPYTIADFRAMVAEVVTEKMLNDNNLCLINGAEISDATMLAPGDPTHLSEYGASKLADALYLKINDCGSSSSVSTLQTNSRIQIKQWSNNQLQITSEVSAVFDLSVFSMEGKLMYKKSINVVKGENTITSNEDLLSNGLYLVKIQNQNDSSSTKVWVK